MVDRLRDFTVPYQHALATEAGQRNVLLSLAGLLSHLDRKNAEKIAALVDVERLVLQEFIGTAPWDHRPLIRVLDVCFISSLPVMQRLACKAWADKRPVQIVWAVS
jgi:hypothetical protein